MNAHCAAPILSGAQGQLVVLSYEVDPKHLEDLLEALASLSFPVNPQLYHHPHSATVEFPAYSGALSEVKNALAAFGFSPSELKIAPAF